MNILASNLINSETKRNMYKLINRPPEETFIQSIIRKYIKPYWVFHLVILAIAYYLYRRYQTTKLEKEKEKKREKKRKLLQKKIDYLNQLKQQRLAEMQKMYIAQQFKENGQNRMNDYLTYRNNDSYINDNFLVNKNLGPFYLNPKQPENNMEPPYSTI